MSEHYYAVIMAGGGGTRLWPLSRNSKPKQMLKLDGDRSLFQVAVDRLVGLFPLDHIYVVTSEDQAVIFQEHSPEIPVENYIIEPSGKDTAAAIGLAAMTLNAKDPQAVMAVVTADHFIDNVGRFLHALRAAEEVAAKGFLVTMGILPTFPSTGFGYIQQGNYLGTFEGIVVFEALSFKEKPDRESAVKFVEDQDHSWNSGMFIWQTGRVLGEIERQMPKLNKALKAAAGALGTEKYEKVLSKAWKRLEKVSIDFGIMEGAENVAVIPAKGLGWNDVGSWNALFDVLDADESGNVFSCNQHLNLGAQGSLVFANREVERLIVTIGVEDLVVVDTGDVLLVCSKEQAQDVRQVVKMLAEQGLQEYL